jgi:hypothetical protein
MNADTEKQNPPRMNRDNTDRESGKSECVPELLAKITGPTRIVEPKIIEPKDNCFLTGKVARVRMKLDATETPLRFVVYGLRPSADGLSRCSFERFLKAIDLTGFSDTGL